MSIGAPPFLGIQYLINYQSLTENLTTSQYCCPSQYNYVRHNPLSELYLLNARNILETGSTPGCHQTKNQLFFNFTDRSKDKCNKYLSAHW
jgi:hypothetical protein